MDMNSIFDEKALNAILADAKKAGIDAEDVKKVLAAVPNGGKAAPTRGASPEGELVSLLEEDKDALTAQISDATGVERGKAGSILMLAAPFILKYLLSSGSSSQGGTGSLLGTLLGAQQPQPQPAGGMDLLSLLLGAQQPQQQPTSLLGSLLGGGQPQQNNSNAATAALLAQLLAQQQAQSAPQAPLQSLGGTQQSGGMDLNALLGSLLGGGQPQQPQQTQTGGGLGDLLLGLFGDNGK